MLEEGQHRDARERGRKGVTTALSAGGGEGETSVAGGGGRQQVESH